MYYPQSGGVSRLDGQLAISTTELFFLTSDAQTLEVYRLGDGEITVQSNDESICTVELAETTMFGGKYAITPIADGETTLTVSVAKGIGYRATDSQTVNVYAALQGSELEDATWETISRISAEGIAANYWSVGDTKSIELAGTMGLLTLDTTLYVYILGFDHNYELEGKGITFSGFKSDTGKNFCLAYSYGSSSYRGAKYFNINHYGTYSSSEYYTYSYGGWAACDMRYDILGSTDIEPEVYGSNKTSGCTGYDATETCATNPVEGTLMSCLPEDLRAVMKPITKYTDNVGGNKNTEVCITATIDYLPLLAEYEVSGTRSRANVYEQNYQEQYEYYGSGNTAVKYQHNSTSSTAMWWTRSAGMTASNIWTVILVNVSSITTNSYQIYYSYGVVPLFLI